MKSGEVLQYFHVPLEQMWQLTSPPREPKEGEKPKEDWAYGTMQLEAPCDIERLVASQLMEIKAAQMTAQYKNIQEKVTGVQFQIYGVGNGFCPWGVKHLLENELILIKNKISKSDQPGFQFVGEPIPKMNVFFRGEKDGKLPAATHKELTLNNIAGFKDHGCRVVTIEMAPTSCIRLKPVLNYAHDKGILQKLLGRRAYKCDATVGNLSVATIIKQQRNKRAHIQYCEKLTYVQLSDIVTTEKLVEVTMLDGSVAKPKFTNLRLELMKLKLPECGLDLIEAVIPCMKGLSAGLFEIALRRGNTERGRVAKNMV